MFHHRVIYAGPQEARVRAAGAPRPISPGFLCPGVAQRMASLPCPRTHGWQEGLAQGLGSEMDLEAKSDYRKENRGPRPFSQTRSLQTGVGEKEGEGTATVSTTFT